MNRFGLNLYLQLALLCALWAPSSAELKFEHFRPNNSGFPVAFTLNIFEDSNGTVWFGTRRAGVVRYDGQRFKTITSRDGLLEDRIQSITEGPQGQLFFGSFSRGISVFDGSNWRSITAKVGLPNEHVTQMSFIGYNFWVATAHGVGHFDGQRWRHYSPARKLLFEKGKWELVKIFPRHKRLSTNKVNTVLANRNNQVLIGTETGAAVLEDDGWRRIKSEKGMIDYEITSSCYGPNNSIWMGTHHNGVLRIDGLAIDTFDTTNSIEHNGIRSLNYGNGILAVGTNGGGLSLLYQGKWKTLRVKSGLLSNYVMAVVVKPGHIWVGYYLDGVTKITYDSASISNFFEQE